MIDKLLLDLRKSPENYREILPSLFNKLDPDKKYHKELIWLMAIPASLIKDLHPLVVSIVHRFTPEPTTIGEVIELTMSRNNSFLTMIDGKEEYLQVSGYYGPKGDKEYAIVNYVGKPTHCFKVPSSLPIKWVF